MQVELSDRSEKFARAAVEAGYAKDVCDAVAIALLRLEQSQLEDQIPSWDDTYAAEVNSKIEAGLVDIREGRTIVANSTYFDELRTRMFTRSSAAQG